MPSNIWFFQKSFRKLLTNLILKFIGFVDRTRVSIFWNFTSILLFAQQFAGGLSLFQVSKFQLVDTASLLLKAILFVVIVFMYAKYDGFPFSSILIRRQVEKIRWKQNIFHIVRVAKQRWSGIWNVNYYRLSIDVYALKLESFCCLIKRTLPKIYFSC